MQPFKINKSIIDKHGDLSRFVRHGWLQDKLLYITSRTHRQTTELVKWLDDFVASPDKIVHQFASNILEEQPTDWIISTKGQYDNIILDVLRIVKNHVLYVRDIVAWKDPDKWQSPKETLELHRGDCEDGAILAYVLARKCGVPSHRLYIWMGEVLLPNSEGTGGHACLLYIPDEYPLNAAFMDWCYAVSTKPIPYRALYQLDNQGIQEWIASKSDEWIQVQQDTGEHYIATWGIFNEDGTYASMRRSATSEAYYSGGE